MTGLNITDVQGFLGDESTHLDDQSVAQTGGGNFERKRLPIGRHPIRMVSYIEMGTQPGGKYDGKDKPDENQVSMSFEFLGKRTVEEIEKEGEPTKLFAPRKHMTKKLSYHTKAGFFKLFQQMRAGDSNITHMAQMLATHAWLVTVEWRTKGEDGEYITIKKSEIEKYEERLKNAKTDAEKKDFRIFDNIKWDTLGAPVMPILDEDGEDTGETRALKVREVIGDLQLFLWDNPAEKFWASLHIEGSYTKKVDGKDVEVSKNFIQEKIMAAKNFDGSPLQAMLEGTDNLPGMVGADDGSMPDGEAPDVPDDVKKEVDEVIPDEEIDELDELGLA